MADKSPPNITHFHRAALHSLIFDPDQWESKYAEMLSKDANPSGYSTLLGFSLGVALRRKFPSTWSLADVIKYVAHLRIALGGESNLIPSLAEKIIRLLLNDKLLKDAPPFGSDSAGVLATEHLLLMALVAEADLDAAALYELINEAADKAREFDWSALALQGTAGSLQAEGTRAITGDVQ
ncbi:hypothetical protein ACQPZP_28560 [Spirillospora sp. CA-142024]|uniref:hypothetical protein n=1 Tax=Spirillospora sp. CA-142024 TaxID=3240036 RepID=UPI003D9446D5